MRTVASRKLPKRLFVEHSLHQCSEPASFNEQPRFKCFTSVEAHPFKQLTLMDLEHTGTRHCQHINRDRCLVGESNTNGVTIQLPEGSEASPNLRQSPS